MHDIVLGFRNGTQQACLRLQTSAARVGCTHCTKTKSNCQMHTHATNETQVCGNGAELGHHFAMKNTRAVSEVNLGKSTLGPPMRRNAEMRSLSDCTMKKTSYGLGVAVVGLSDTPLHHVNSNPNRHNVTKT